MMEGLGEIITFEETTHVSTRDIGTSNLDETPRSSKRLK